VCVVTAVAAAEWEVDLITGEDAELDVTGVRVCEADLLSIFFCSSQL